MKSIDVRLAQIEEEANKRPVKDNTEKLRDRFTNKPWLIRNGEYRRWVRPLSIFLQLISALFGFYGAKVLMEYFPIPIPYFELVGAGAMVFTMELFKRKFSDRFWDSFFAYRERDRIEEVSGLSPGRIRYGAAVGNLLILAFSFYLTVGGGFFMTKDNSPEAKLTGANSDPEAQALVAERNELRATKAENDQKIATHEANKVKDNGRMVISWPSQKAIQGLEESNTSIDMAIATITETLRNKHGVYDIQNKEILSDAKTRSTYAISTVIGILAFLEILFECLMAFASYYDVRMLIAQEMSQGGSRPKQMNGKKVRALAV